MGIAERIQMLRGNNTRDKFSRIVNIHPQTLYKYEKGTGSPNLESIESICETLKINYEWLMTGRGPMRRCEDSGDNHIYSDAPTQKTREITCTACTELKKELDIEREERRTLAAENRHLWRENGDIREKHARIEERYHQDVVNRSNKESFVEISDAG